MPKPLAKQDFGQSRWDCSRSHQGRVHWSLRTSATQSAGFNLTPRDQQVVEVLATRVRVITFGQVATHWFKGSLAVAHQRCMTLQRARLVEVFTMPCRPPLILLRPMHTWTPVANMPFERSAESPTELPDFHALSYACCTRWSAPVVPTRMLTASPAGCTRFGAVFTRRPRRSEVSHDVTLGGIYLTLRANNPELARTWQTEGVLRTAGFGAHRKLPDAMVLRAGIQTVVELGGTYPACRLKALHDFCAARRLPYELW